MTLSKSETDALRAELGLVSRAYLRQARALSYRELRTNQDAPWASIAFGAAGIATALWWPGRSRRASKDLAIARRWLSSATRGSRAKGAFGISTFGEPNVDSSLYYGADGLRFLRLLFACGDRGKGALEPSVRSFLGRCRRRLGGPSELLQGIAGTLTALVLLYRALGEPRVLRVADELANDLLERAGGRWGWARASRLGFAHGRSGTFHALLGWSLAAERELPSGFFGHLALLAEDVKRSGTLGAPSSSDPAEARALERSWCNGAAGLVLLWARAYQHTSDATYLRHARQAARFILTHTDAAGGDLCCGLGGRAYALLAMDRVEPDRGWFDRAIVMASCAAGAMLEGGGPWPNGLYKGYPGLVCLGRDLLKDPSDRAGFPLVEAP